MHPTSDVLLARVEMVQADDLEVHDLTVEGASHYVTWGGFIAQNCIFDELTHFTEGQYKAIRARIRGTDPTLPRWTRATSNPGGIGHEWVFKRFGAWLDPSYPNPAKPGEVRHFQGDQESEGERSISRSFIPAKRKDNPHVGPEYDALLADLDPVRRAQLEDGDWTATYGERDLWDHRWVKQWLDRLPDNALERVRAWDFGATAGGDWTVGARLSRTTTGIVVEDVERMRGTPAEVRETFARVARRDLALDPTCVQWIPQDPGQAGIDQVQSYLRDMPDITIRSRRPTTDKVTAFGSFSAHSQGGLIAWCKGAWNKPVIATLEAFPKGKYDDDCDALSMAFTVLYQPVTEGAMYESDMSL